MTNVEILFALNESAQEAATLYSEASLDAARAYQAMIEDNPWEERAACISALTWALEAALCQGEAEARDRPTTIQNFIQALVEGLERKNNE